MTASSLPAILGGIPVRPQGPPPWPPSDPDIGVAMETVWRTGDWGKYHGESCPRLVEALQSLHQIEHVHLCGSGTFAVELALRSLNVQPGDEVLLAGYDYPGNFLCVHALNALPVLVDLAPTSFHLDVALLEQAVGPKTKALIVSHLHGCLAPMARIMSWAQDRKVAVVEDAAQASGAILQGKRVGTWGDVGILSFGGSKLLTAGRGGALLTQRADVAQRARAWQLRGNILCPLSELQAAVLLPQVTQLEQRNQHRWNNVRFLKNQLASDRDLVFPEESSGNDAPSFYKLGAFVRPELIGLTRSQIVRAMRVEGIALDEGFSALQVGRSSRRYRQGSNLDQALRAHHDAVILHHPILLGGTAAMEQIGLAWHKIMAHRDDLHDFFARVKNQAGDAPESSVQ